MIQYVYEGASQSKFADKVIVATDSEEVLELVKSFGGDAVLTPSDLPSGTDRVYYATKELDYDIIVNLQGDEPLIKGEILDKIIAELQHTDADIVTPYKISYNEDEIEDENRVKIVADSRGYALYFSRSVIPFNRERIEKIPYKIHIGIYGYKKESLEKFVKAGYSILESTEKLEQLRALEHGFKIKLIEVQYDSIPVDVPGDITRVEEILKRTS